VKTQFTFPCGCLAVGDESGQPKSERCPHGTRMICWAPNHFDMRPDARMAQLAAMDGGAIYQAMADQYLGNYHAAPAWVTPCNAASPTDHLRQMVARLDSQPRSYLDVGSGSVGPSDYWHYNDMPMDHRITSDAFELRDDGGTDPSKWVFLLAFAQDLGGLLSRHRFDLIIVPETLEHIPADEHKATLDSIESLLSDRGLLCITACNEGPHFHDQAREQCAVNPVGPFRNLPSCDMLRDRGYDVYWNKGYQILAYKRGR
jgi:hypothetical protein